ncbi:hypothetical protein [Paraburkholderia sp. SIMBA_030]|uniref:hypothetical protein n=1 Tax=Paraburkholderia sp. SIMBA_030 TaxID=3085773 RepID=UPI00397908D7
MDVLHTVIGWMRDSANVGLAAWAQAVGSAFAVIAAFTFPTLQSKRDAKLRAADQQATHVAHAAALRLIAIESEEAISELVGTLKLVPSSPPSVYGFPHDDHPQLAIFGAVMAELLPRISTLLQQPVLSDSQIGTIVAIRGCLKDARVLFDAVHDPYREFDTRKKDQAASILSRIETLRGEAQHSYTSAASRH